MRFFLSLIATFLIFFIIPIIVYGLFSRYWGLKEPNKKKSFFIGVLIQKIGTSIGFVTLFLIGKQFFSTNWFSYCLVWTLMFTLTEIGQTYMPNYSKKEAIAGIISEILYFPLAGITIALMLS